MAPFLIGEEGPLSGLTVSFEEGDEWVIGRDPDLARVVLEDPMVSRKHACVRRTDLGYLLDNYSTVNPVTQNGKIVTESVTLKEGDILQIGSTFFRFTKKEGEKREEAAAFPAREEEKGFDISALHLEAAEGRWLLKVIAGPNSGAEATLQKGQSYILGKDPTICDVLFQDLSVSRQHARISVDEREAVFIEDLNSRNGVIINGKMAEGRQEIKTQDVVALGTTVFLIIDKEAAYETIVSKPLLFPTALEEEKIEPVRPWRELMISKRHLLMAGIAVLLLLAGVASLFSLFKTQAVIVTEKGETEEIQEKMARFPEVQFSFNVSSGKLFLTGHILTATQHEEMLYFLHTLPFIQSIEDSVVIDEYVWSNMNGLLSSNPDWEGISIHAAKPGRFVMNGYLDASEDLDKLTDYVNLYFPYLDHLENRVIVETNLKLEISKLLEESQLLGVQFDVKKGEVIIAGRVDADGEDRLKEAIEKIKALQGVRRIDNFAVLTTLSTSFIDLTEKYTVSGTSKKNNKEIYVVINGKILGKGDLLDGMLVTDVDPQRVVLEKDGIKFQIHYNLQ
ncbi:MAG: EscD/YscD/HrpQ family type III secretion system inner membrane ring protein [Chlamydiae bacterium RIFCSPLOWO2_12_FULL_49_12]|nr:MAG: EscD/YscD/HrpQ family type III secretion system inner membrane ring protein [Chlamydiae bacterium RIFCSPLOWO2_12_FULL_49_12]